MARKYVEEDLDDDIYDVDEGDDDDGSDDEYDDDVEEEFEDEKEDFEDDSEEEDDIEEDQSHKSKGVQKRVEEPQYSAKHVTKIISAKHNKMKKQFTAKYEEAMSQTAGELDSANAIVNWLCQQSSMTREQVLARIGYQPTTKKVTVDEKLFDISNPVDLDDDIQAQVNKIQSRINSYPGFKENKKMIIEYAQDTGLPVDKAYWALMGEKAANVAKKRGADEVLARKTSKASRVTESGNASAKVKTYSKSDREAAKAVGMSVEDYVKYQNMENYDDYQKASSRKKRR